MKKAILLYLLCCVHAIAQEHFSGINNAGRIGIINGSVNPAEFANLSSQYEINIFAISINASSNKVGFQDLTGGSDFDQLIFKGTAPTNLRFDSEIFGPSFGMKWNNWGFAITSKTNAKLNVVDVDPVLGRAIIDENLYNITTISNVATSKNQRLNATTWGEIGLSAARTVYENDRHKFNGGITVKLLFPGSYANFGADEMYGTVVNKGDSIGLTNTRANLNIAYSGSLANDFSDAGNYTSALFGKLNGAAVDFGINYSLKEDDGYRVKAGIALRNLGGMTFKSNNNSLTDYRLAISATDTLNLNQFNNSESLQETETILLNSGYLDRSIKRKTDFKVKLPTVFSFYADVKIVPKFFVALYTQQKFSDDSENDQVTTQNVISITPRFSLDNYEFYSTWASNEVSGVTGGIGVRLAGFFLGSSSILTGLIGSSDQADFYLGYSFGLK